MSSSLSNRITALVLCLCLMLGMVPPAQAAELAITSQPKSVYVEAGEKASVSVAATGDNLSYQWYIAAQGSTKFTKSSVTKAAYSITMSDRAISREASRSLRASSITVSRMVR